MFRIVAEKRGDAVTGFRVQIMGRSRRGSENCEFQDVWRNKGRKVYTVEDATMLREFFEREYAAAMPAITYEEIPGIERSRPEPEFFGQYGRK